MSYAAPIPHDEVLRLQRVSEFCPSETERDEVFDKIIEMTANLFEAPIALITIVGENRQWFRARIGIDADESPRNSSFCAHSIVTKKKLEIIDTHLDDRFKGNPMVLGEPHIRYYAGAPLITDDGLVLGSLCIMDTRTRAAMTSKESSTLNYLSELVMMRMVSLRSRNFIDQSTGLLNRVRLEEDIRDTLLSGDPSQLFVVETSTPEFLNDLVKALGYSFSENVILEIKRRLRALLPKDRELYRVSPTRFGFIQNNSETAENLSKIILNSFSKPLECRGIPFQMQIGIGVLPLLSDLQLGDDWLRLVISAASSARERKIGWTQYEAKFDEEHKRAFMLLSSLPNAVKAKDQLYLVFQPKIDLNSFDYTGVEALIRWNHPTLGIIAPAEFIPLAQKTALMQPLTNWVLRNVFKQAAAWKTEGLNLKIAMNLTVTDLESASLVNEVFKLMGHYQLPPKAVEFELTESELMTNASEVLEQLNRLRAMNIEISIDDFGTGYSNWTYIKEIPATAVKLDQSLTKSLEKDKKSQRMVKTLIDLALRMGLRVIAEGVETEKMLITVKKLSCSEAQGYFIAKPMDAKKTQEWLKNYHPTDY